MAKGMATSKGPAPIGIALLLTTRLIRAFSMSKNFLAILVL